MKSIMFALVTAAMIVGSSGCALNPLGKGGHESAGCATCGGGQQLLVENGAAGFQSGPTSAQVAYPYYTVRGPRDFLAKNPRSVGR